LDLLVKLGDIYSNFVPNYKEALNVYEAALKLEPQDNSLLSKISELKSILSSKSLKVLANKETPTKKASPKEPIKDDWYLMMKYSGFR